MWLTKEEVAELTGIRRGHDGKTRNQLQCEHLRRIGIPFFPNASGEPKIARCYFDKAAEPARKKTSWQSAVSNA